ncbi:uncharacterized protein TNCV_3639681 [Trichonephila clavipes]|nr:uncharacterized protein TNCV_3639681 [Trichonephila clavipes]
MDAISRRYRKPKDRPSKRRSLCASKVQKRWEKNHMQSDSDITMCPKNSDIFLAENSLIMDTENSISDEGSHAGEKEQYLNANARILQMFPSTSTSTFCTSEKSTYVLMNNDMWSSLLSNIKCNECAMCSFDVECNSAYGFSTKIELKCKSCKKIFNSVLSSPLDDDSKCFDANEKLVEAFLKIGKGPAALELFSMAIGIHAMDKKTSSKCLHKLYEEKCSFKEDILEISRKVVRKHYEDLLGTANGVIDITVSYDGALQKLGHSSLYGIGIVIDILTGLIIDYEILSKYCPECTTAKRDLGENSAEYSIWYKSHQEECSENYVVSSNAMEVKAAEILWKRSIKNCGMQYVSILSDGDAKTYQYLSALNVYDDCIKIVKEECINHVTKRLGTGLRNKISEWRNKCITIGGRKEGNLKENTIVKLTNFYRKAIKDNAPDVKKMKGALLASLFHCSSTDKTPKYSKCPTGSTSWLANDELLERCSAGKTQNANESIHSVIWKNCPKETFVSKERLEMGIISAIGGYNFGCFNSLAIEHNELSAVSVDISHKRDKRRLA